MAYALVAIMVGSASASIVRGAVIDDPSPVLNEDSVHQALQLEPGSSGDTDNGVVASSTPSSSATRKPTAAPSATAQSGSGGGDAATPTPSLTPSVDRTPTSVGTATTSPATPSTSQSSTSAAPPAATPTPAPSPTRSTKPRPKLRFRYFPTAGGIVLASCRGPILRVRAAPAFNWRVARVERARSRAVVHFIRNDALREITVTVRCINGRPVSRIHSTRAPVSSITTAFALTPTSPRALRLK